MRPSLVLVSIRQLLASCSLIDAVMNASPSWRSTKFLSLSLAPRKKD